MCFLVGMLPDGSRFRHEVPAGRTTVGRFSLSTIRLEEESISPLHAELIALDNRRYLVRDLHSQHGIAVDGREVFEEEITAPCRLTFGRLTCDLQVEAPVFEETVATSAQPAVEAKAKTKELAAAGNFTPIRPPVTAPRAKGRPTPPHTHPGAPSEPGYLPGVAPLQITLPKVVRPPRKAPANKVATSPVSVVQTATQKLSAEAEPAQVGLPHRAAHGRGTRLILTASLLLLGCAAGLVVEGRNAATHGRVSLFTKLVGEPEANARAQKAFLAKIPPAPPTVTTVSAPLLERPTASAKPPLALPSPTPLGAKAPVILPQAEEPTTPEVLEAASPKAIATPAVAKLQPAALPEPAPAPAPVEADALPAPVTPAETASAPIVSAVPESAPAMVQEVAPAPEPPPRDGQAPEATSGELLLALNNSAPKVLDAPTPAPTLEAAPAPAMLEKTEPQPAESSSPLVTVAGDLASALQSTPPVPAPPSSTESAAAEKSAANARGKWGFATPSRNPRWDASAGALLASNDWKLSARQMMESAATATDAPSQVASWYFGSTQPEDAIELARLDTKPEGLKPPPALPVPVSPEKVSVMILGDSLALCGFGNRIDHLFRAAPNVRATNTYMACGTVPMSWLKEGSFANLKTYCGFWSIEQPSATGKKPVNLQDTYGMGRGKPKAHAVPKLEDLFEKAAPEVLVLQTGTNLFSLFQDGKTVIPSRHGPMLRGQIQPFLAKLLKMPHPPRAIYWVASPTSGRVSPEVQEFVLQQVREQVGDMATIIDSRELVSYPYKHAEPDKEHFMGEDMDQWADAVYARIQKDLSMQGLPASLPLPPGFAAGGQALGKSTPAAAAAALRVTARLVLKSEPFSLDQTYGESMVAYVYDVEKVESGEYQEKQILVMHPAHIGKKLQPDLKKLQIGKSYSLKLRDLDTSIWNTEKKCDDTGLIDLLPYLRVEDEARHPAAKR